MSLLRQVFNLYINLPIKSLLLFNICILVRIALNLLPIYYMNLAISSDENISSYGMKMYAVSTIFESVATYFINSIEILVISDIVCVFIEKSYKKYSTLSFESKNQVSSTEFHQKLTQSCGAVQYVLSSGIHSVINFIVCVTATIFIFIKEDKIWIIFVYALINLVMYFAVTKNLQQKLTNYISKVRDQREKTQCLINCKLPWLEVNNDEVENLINLEQSLTRMYSQYDRLWMLVGNVTSFINSLPYVVVILDPALTITYFLLIVKMFGNVSSSIRQCMNLINVYKNHNIRYESYTNMWKDKTFCDQQVISITVPDKIVVEQVNISIGSSVLTGENIIVSQGDQILIKGASGTGKTTFINGLFGKIKGVELDENQPENYYSGIVEFYQNIKEKIPTSKITVRQLFFDETNNDVIRNCLKMAHVDNWISDYDVLINNKISGGQKTRLALATRLYLLMKNIDNKQIFVVDEPEQGSDPDVAYAIVENITKYCKQNDVTLLIISHLEQLSNSKWKWNSQIKVEKLDSCKNTVRQFF